jgi:hypothetical protein
MPVHVDQCSRTQQMHPDIAFKTKSLKTRQTTQHQMNAPKRRKENKLELEVTVLNQMSKP